MLSNVEDKEYVRKLFRTKDGIIAALSEAINRTTMNEAILLEVYLNIEIRRLMEKENLDKISTILFKIAPEGQTYKIYEQILITVYRESQEFYEVVRKYFKNPEEFLERLSSILDPNGVVFDALRNINKYDEANNILRAVQGLYTFIVLGDVSGWYVFLREMNNACRKLENSTKASEKRRHSKYVEVLKALS